MEPEPTLHLTSPWVPIHCREASPCSFPRSHLCPGMVWQRAQQPYSALQQGRSSSLPCPVVTSGLLCCCWTERTDSSPLRTTALQVVAGTGRAQQFSGVIFIFTSSLLLFIPSQHHCQYILTPSPSQHQHHLLRHPHYQLPCHWWPAITVTVTIT